MTGDEDGEFEALAFHPASLTRLFLHPACGWVRRLTLDRTDEIPEEISPLLFLRRRLGRKQGRGEGGEGDYKIL